MKKVLAITFLIVLLDQIIKIYVKSTMFIGQEGIDLGFFRVLFVENPGMAFGAVLPGAYGKITLSVFRVIAVIFGLFYINKQLKNGATILFSVCASLVLAGAIGNLLDGAFYGLLFSESTPYLQEGVATFLPAEGGYESFMMGSVVDMFQFTVSWPSWMPWLGGDEIFPLVFNVADSSITIGVFIIIIWQKRFFKAIHPEVEALTEESTNEQEA